MVREIYFLPDFELELNSEIILDKDGVDGGNLDGTFYLNDPATIKHAPNLKWLSERGPHLSVETTREGDINRIYDFDCNSNSCIHQLNQYGLITQDIHLTNGQGITIHNATEIDELGNNNFRYNSKIFNLDEEISETQNDITILFPTHDPVMESHTYTVLKDNQKTAYLDREGIALKYHGSWGNGPDDDGELHENRRAKINDFSAVSFASNGFNIIQLNTTTKWAGSETDTMTNQEPENVFMSGFNETALFKQAGYGKVFLISDLEEIVRKKLVVNATTYSTLKTIDFADIKIKYLTNESYRYPAKHHDFIN